MRRYLDTSGEIGNSWLNQIMTAEQLVKNSIWLFGAEATSKLIGLATQIIAARYLGDRGYGNYSLAFALSGVFIIFLDNSLSAYLCKQVSCHRTKADQYLKGVFGLKKLLAFPIIAILICLVILIPGEREIKVVVCAIGLALILNGFTDMYLAVFRAFERMSLVYVLMVVQRALFFLFGFAALLMGYLIVPFAILFLVVSVFSLILAHWNMQRRSEEKEVLTEFGLSKKIMKDCLPVCGIFLFSYVYFRIDVVFIYFMLGEAETGWYNAAFKWLEVLALMVASIRLALLPALSRAYAGQDEQFQGIGREAVRYLLLIGLPLTVGTFTLAPKLVEDLGLLYRSRDSHQNVILIYQDLAKRFPESKRRMIWQSYVLEAVSRAGTRKQIIANLGKLSSMLLDALAQDAASPLVDKKNKAVLREFSEIYDSPPPKEKRQIPQERNMAR